MLLVLALVIFFSLGTLTGCNMGGDDDEGSSFQFQSDLNSLPRAIFLTDPELDDFNSMEHMLLYSNNINLAGLIYQSSMHWRGTQYKGEAIPPGRWPAEGDELHIDQAIDLYEEVYPNLVRHDSNYPSPSYLRSITKRGNMDIPGDYSEFTEGAQLIYDILMDDKPEKVFVGCWGGMSTLAAAINRLPTDQATKTKIAKKLVVTAYGFQDSITVDNVVSRDGNATVFRSIINYSPDIEYREESSTSWGYMARGGSWGSFRMAGVRADQLFYLQPAWMQKNVSSVGPLGQAYRVWGNGRQMAPGDIEDYFWLCQETDESKLDDERTWLQGLGYMVWLGPYVAGSWLSEGDSGNWAILVDNGLRAWEGPNYGGWGGRHVKNTAGNATYGATNMWSLASSSGGDDLTADGTRSESVYSRWFNSIMDGFAARLQWTIKSPDACNHEPTVRITNNITNNGTLDFTAAKGATVTLTAEIHDRDGDGVWLNWWEYQEADSYAGVAGVGGTSKTNTFTIPQDANSGDTIHIIAEAKDSGSPSLTSWQRVVITVK
jgi:hypothetical protein